MVAAYQAEENRHVVGEDLLRELIIDDAVQGRDLRSLPVVPGVPARPPDGSPGPGWSARIPANIGYGSRTSPASSANCRIGS